jgi:hypothetical protein
MDHFGLFQARMSTWHRHLLIDAAIWALIALLLNLSWEIAQFPFYQIPASVSIAHRAYYVFHCTAGDAIIATALFLLAGWVLSAPDWPSTRPWTGAVIVMLVGVGYMAFSEWRNVYELHAWRYASSMPLVFGIGVAPLLQWICVPVITLYVYRRISAWRRRTYG